MTRTIHVCPTSSRLTPERTVAAALFAVAMTVGSAPQCAAQQPASAETADPGPADPSWSDHAAGDWFGVRAALLRRGLSIEIELQPDHSTNLSGGLRRGSVLRRPTSLALSLETEPLLGWRGGRFRVAFQMHGGSDGTEALVGDAQGFDNIDAAPFRQVSELWFEQQLFGGRLRLRLGKLDANGDFAFVEHGSEFLNSSAGVSPTILGFPSYPDPAAGANLFLFPGRSLYAGFGAYDGATHEGCHGRTGNRGPATLWGEPAAMFLAGEVGLRWKLLGRFAGRAGAGAWQHTGAFERFEGGRDEGAAGPYVVLDQALWRERVDPEDEQGLAAFARLGWASRHVSLIDQHVGFGLVWSGAIPGRDRDVLGAMASSARFTDVLAETRLRKREIALEVFYKLQVLAWFGVKSDLQYIANPGAHGARHALVGTVRAQLAF